MTPRKRGEGTHISGRPPKDPFQKVGTPVRALVTMPVADQLAVASRTHGIDEPGRGKVSSDILRLYIYNGLVKDGLMTTDLRNDPTWAGLVEMGLV